MKNGSKLNIKRGDIIQIDENPDRREAVGDIAFRFSAAIYVQRFRTSKAMRKAIPRILIESTVNNVGEIENEGEYIGAVRGLDVGAGSMVKLYQNKNRFRVMYLKRMFPTSNDEAVDVAKHGDRIRFQVISKAEFQHNPEPEKSFEKTQENHEKTEKSPVFLAVLVRVSKPFSWYSSTIYVESKVSRDDQHLCENIGVVTYGDIKVGDTVQSRPRRIWGDDGKIKWIKKVTPTGNDEEVEEAKCGDRIRFQVMISLRLGTGGGVYVPCEYPLRLKPGVQLKAPDKDDAPFWRLYPKAFKTKRPLYFAVFIGNGTAKCHIHSIKGKRQPPYKYQLKSARIFKYLISTQIRVR